MKQQCSKCHNTVVGQFAPSETRKWLTALAKKGGMKGVLSAAGSALGGIGAIPGFLAGTAIDVIYGKDINKLVDKIADQFDDNKIYVFECPNCGHTWTSGNKSNIQNRLGIYDDEDDVYEDFDEDEEDEDEEDEFTVDFSDFFDKIDAAAHDLNLMNKLYIEMGFKGAHYRNDNNVLASQYYFLGGLCALLYAKDNYEFDNPHKVNKQLEEAGNFLRYANELFPDKEYELMLACVDTLLAEDPEECANLDTIEAYYYSFDNNTLLKEDFLIHIYEECRFQSILHADKIVVEAEEEYDDDVRVKLWRSGLRLQDKDYCMFCNLKLFLLSNDERTSTGKMTIKQARYLNDAYSTDGYTIEKCDTNKPFDRQWLLAAVDYAKSIIEDTNPYYARDIDQGMEILNKIATLDKCNSVIFACCQLAEYYEEGTILEKNITKALSYYKKAGSEDNIARLMAETKTSGTSSSLSDSEAEYLEEVKECLENGVISNGERRLLEKLRIKLGISEERAAELEQSLLTPQLTDEEQEYLAEYKECLAENGEISVGERRLLNRLRDKLDISEQRASKIEKSV